jgi:hypothetical protein
MKKYLFILAAIISLVHSAEAQSEYSLREKTEIAENIDSLLIKYFDLSTITKKVENEKKNTKETNVRIAQFRNLFDKDATIYDDINPRFSYAPKKGEQAYMLEEKNLTDYFNGLIDEFPLGLITVNNKVNISYQNFGTGTVEVALDRTISGVSYSNKYHISNHDTLKLTLRIKSDKEVKISKVEKIGNGYNLKLLNDKDLDGVINEEDNCPTEKGRMALKGCPDTDNDGIIDKDDYCPDEFGPKENNGCPATTFSYRYVSSVSAGLGWSNTNLSLGTLAETGYNKSLKSGSGEDANQGTITNGKYQFGFNLNGLIGYYFGKTKGNRNKGISLGIMLTNYTADYTLNDIQYYFGEADPYNTNDNSLKYEKRITLRDSAKETIQYNYFSFPILFKIKDKFEKIPKLAWELGFGPSILYSRATLKAVKATVDFEGVYQVDENGKINYSATHAKSDYDIRLIASEIESKKTNGNNETPSVDELFAAYRQNGLDVNRGVSFDNNFVETKSEKINYALNLTGDIFYHISARAAIKVGFAFFYGPGFKNKSTQDNEGNNYQMIVEDENADPAKLFNNDNGSGGAYNSIYNSAIKQSFISFGINTGIIFGL